MLKSFVDSSLHLRPVLDAIPSYVFIVDSDLRIGFANRQALELVGEEPTRKLRRLCGELLHCIHERESDKKCGHTIFCSDCALRQAIDTCKDNKSVFRQKHKMSLELKGIDKEFEFLVTASLVNDPEEYMFLMILEDITELSDLRILTTVCMNCTKVRNEKGEWEEIHEYLARKEKMLFSHGFCPECGKAEREKIEQEPSP